MTEAKLPRPTDAELEILKVLWNRGPSTVRQVYDVLRQSKSVAYNTVLTFLQIMTQKGLAIRDSTVRPQVYRPAEPQKRAERQLLDDFLDRAFDGSVRKLVAAMAGRKMSRKELAEIRDLLAGLEEEER